MITIYEDSCFKIEKVVKANYCEWKYLLTNKSNGTLRIDYPFKAEIEKDDNVCLTEEDFDEKYINDIDYTVVEDVKYVPNNLI